MQSSIREPLLLNRNANMSFQKYFRFTQQSHLLSQLGNGLQQTTSSFFQRPVCKIQFSTSGLIRTVARPRNETAPIPTPLQCKNYATVSPRDATSSASAFHAAVMTAEEKEDIAS